MTMYTYIRNILYAFIIAYSFTACSSKTEKKSQQNKPKTSVDVVIAQIQKISNTTQVSGSVLANEMVELHPEVSGRITYLNIPDGAFVTEGTVLARINDADLQAQLVQIKAQLNLVKAQEERLRELIKVRGVNQAEYDAAANEALRVQAQKQVLEAQIEKTIIRAPFSGTLGLRLISPGAYVSPQTKISTVIQTSPIKIDFQVPEVYASSVSVGSEVICKTQDTISFRAKIIAIEPFIQTSTRNIKVRAIANNIQLSPGTYVTITLSEKSQGITVPTHAIIPDANKNQLVVVRNNKAVFVEVETGMRTSTYIEITKGISQGDTIIVSGMLFVRPNQAVTIKQVKSNTVL